ncbi:TPA: fimbria/pilus outer membrane usher protein [Escherichia coli]|nr:fimbrial biogenesis outer membrane usher protein [Escherichia coli]HCN1109492.1 fimbrial biogenesis outer membrane usher protein [Escherichia coli]HCN1114448.1 fimbrial biogenesis outer membrane usher protein [Escherichia coli]HCN3549031.1 fimbrial biogenesis outer membrane usher protein [Escherichia coli]
MSNRNNILYLTYILIPFLSLNAKAESFDSSLLGDGGYPNIDLSVFSKPGGQLPGSYYIDIYLNGNFVDARYIHFDYKNEDLIPCISDKLIESYGVIIPEKSKGKCVDFKSMDGVKYKFHFDRQELHLIIPQKYIKENSDNEAPINLWDFGIPAFLMNYNITGSSWINKKSNSNDSYYATLSPGFNIYKWRFRNNGVWQKTGTKENGYKNINSYLQRALPELHSELTLGDSISGAYIFDSFSFRGLKLETAEEMYPYSQQGFSPRVVGIAKTNAQVIVRQQHNIIYTTSVPPGQFDLSNIIPSKDNGDLYVTVKESDGTEQHFIVPYSSVPILQRKGRIKYDIILGKYRYNNTDVADNKFLQLGAAYGLSNVITVYGGTQLSEDYRSIAAGIGGLSDLGAASIDITGSNAREKYKSDKKISGTALRVRYSKTLETTGTTIAVAGYKYQSKNYTTLSDIYQKHNGNNYQLWYDNNQKNRIDVSVNQGLENDLGSFYLNFVKENYYGDNSVTSFGGGYLLQIGKISLSLNAAKQKIAHSGMRDNYLNLMLSIPLGDKSYSQFGVDSEGKDTSYSVGVLGGALENNELNWGAKKIINRKNKYKEQFAAYSSYNSEYGNIYGGYSTYNFGNNLNYSLNGSAVVYQDGLIFSGQRNENIAIVEAKDVRGINVNMMPGVYTDSNGNAIVSGLMPYKRNQISLNQLSFPDDVEVFQTTKYVIPTSGSIVKAPFNVESGKKALFTVSDSKGESIPFGSIAKVDNTKATIVGPGGELYFAGLPKKGTIIIKYTKNKECKFSYNLDRVTKKGGIYFMNKICQ